MSDMKCPFCQRELGRKNINDIMCSNEKCVSWKRNFYGSEDLWQELIRTRKALDVAVKTLTNIMEYPEDIGDAMDAEDALNQIKQITETKGLDR